MHKKGHFTLSPTWYDSYRRFLIFVVFSGLVYDIDYESAGRRVFPFFESFCKKFVFFVDHLYKLREACSL